MGYHARLGDQAQINAATQLDAQTELRNIAGTLRPRLGNFFKTGWLHVHKRSDGSIDIQRKHWWSLRQPSHEQNQASSEHFAALLAKAYPASQVQGSSANQELDKLSSYLDQGRGRLGNRQFVSHLARLDAAYISENPDSELARADAPQGLSRVSGSGDIEPGPFPRPLALEECDAARQIKVDGLLDQIRAEAKEPGSQDFDCNGAAWFEDKAVELCWAWAGGSDAEVAGNDAAAIREFLKRACAGDQQGQAATIIGKQLGHPALGGLVVKLMDLAKKPDDDGSLQVEVSRSDDGGRSSDGVDSALAKTRAILDDPVISYGVRGMWSDADRDRLRQAFSSAAAELKQGFGKQDLSGRPEEELLELAKQGRGKARELLATIDPVCATLQAEQIKAFDATQAAISQIDRYAGSRVRSALAYGTPEYALIESLLGLDVNEGRDKMAFKFHLESVREKVAAWADVAR
jgi:hypothetical protein